MKKQYNVRFDDEEMAAIESAVPGARTGTAVRIAAISYAQQIAMRKVEIRPEGEQAAEAGADR